MTKVVASFDTASGELELFISSQKAPKHGWMTRETVPKLTWKLNGIQITERDAAYLLLMRAEGTDGGGGQKMAKELLR